MIRLTVYGAPQPAGSKKAFVVRTKQGKQRAVVTDDAKRSRPWKQEVAGAAVEAMGSQPPLEGPLAVRFVFYLRRPKGHYGSGKNAAVVKPSAPPFPAVKPDVLKLARGVEDALSGIVYRDDALIVRELIEKRYGERERVEIEIWDAGLSYGEARST